MHPQQTITPDYTHRPTEWILWFIHGFGIFTDALQSHPWRILTDGALDSDGYATLPAGRFDPDKFLALYGADADEFTKGTAHLVAAVYRGQQPAERGGAVFTFEFIGWSQVAPPKAREHVARWLQDSGPYFP